jgi:hypothetical protein
MLPLFLCALVGLQSTSFRNRIAGGFALLLAMLAKESAPPIATGLGLAWALGAGPAQTRSWTRKLGAGIIPIGVLLFFFDVQVLPKLVGQSYAYQNQFAHFGNSLSDLALAPFLKPQIFFAQLFGKKRLLYLFWTFGPLAFLPLLNPLPLLSALPAYLMLFLAAGDHRVQIIWHYGIEVAIGLFWAMPLALQRFEKRNFWKLNTNTRKITWCTFWVLALFGRSDVIWLRLNATSPHTDWLRKTLVPCISPTVSIAAPVALSSHLSTRYWIGLVPSIDTSNGNTVDCVILDPRIRNNDMSAQDVDQLQKRLKELDYREVLSCQGTQVFELKKSSSCLQCQPQCIPD